MREFEYTDHSLRLMLVRTLVSSESATNTKSVKTPMPTRFIRPPGLALGYFGLDGLPPDLIEIPIAYFRTAIEWFSSRPGVKPDVLGMAGRSRGAELALLLGSRFSAIRSVVAYCPSSIVWNGLRGSTPVDLSAWRESDRPVPFLSLMGPGLADLRSRVLRADADRDDHSRRKNQRSDFADLRGRRSDVAIGAHG